MPIRLLLLALVLFLFVGCATTNTAPLPTQPPAAPTCPRESFLACEPPIAEAGSTLGESEVADARNRARWLACIERHNAWLSCAATLIQRGFLRTPNPNPTTEPDPIDHWDIADPTPEQ